MARSAVERVPINQSGAHHLVRHSLSYFRRDRVRGTPPLIAKHINAPLAITGPPTPACSQYADTTIQVFALSSVMVVLQLESMGYGAGLLAVVPIGKTIGILLASAFVDRMSRSLLVYRSLLACAASLYVMVMCGEAGRRATGCSA